MGERLVGNSFKAYDPGNMERGALGAEFSFYGLYQRLVDRKLDRLC
jgi:hypothetical protein